MAVTAAVSAETFLEPPGRHRRLMTMIVVGLLVSTFVSDSKHARLPLQFLLKSHLHLGPTAMAAFFGLTSLAWYFKPVAGLLSDVVPLWGSRRRNYLILSGLAAGGLWALLAFVPRQYAPLLWVLIGANAFAVLASSVAGGLLVEAGQQQGWTGRMGSLRETIIAGTSLVAQPVGGYLVGHAFGWTCGIGAVFFLGLIPAAFLLLPEPPGERRSRVSGAEALASLRPVFRSRALWLAAGFIFLRDLSPGFGTPLLFYQTDVLHFSPKFLGLLARVRPGHPGGQRPAWNHRLGRADGPRRAGRAGRGRGDVLFAADERRQPRPDLLRHPGVVALRAPARSLDSPDLRQRGDDGPGPAGPSLYPARPFGAA